MDFNIEQFFFNNGSHSVIIFRLKEFFNSRQYLKTKNNRSDVFDANFQVAVAEYQKYHHLTIDDGILNAKTYARIGNELLDVQIDMMCLQHPILKKLLYGVNLTDVCADWDNIGSIVPKEKFIGWGYDYPKIPLVCFRYAWEQLKAMGHDLKSLGWGTSQKMNPDIYQIYLTEDVAGMKKSDLAQQFTEGVLYLKKAIRSKTPVIVGVDDAPDTKLNKKTKKVEVHHDNKDRVTDHFVTIVGMGEDAAGKYFLFYDNSTKYVDIGTSPDNKIYCDCLNFSLIGHADTKNVYAQGGYGQYRITQIRESK